MTFYADLMAQAGSAFETENCEFACPTRSVSGVGAGRRRKRYDYV
jgi:hypothetical protein